MMRTIVAGGREFKPSALWLARVALALHKLGTTVVISGTCRGADLFGEAIADLVGLPIERFPADWKGQGRAAGHVRNAEMAQQADSLVLLPGGPGTASMAGYAAKAGLRVIDLSDRS